MKNNTSELFRGAEHANLPRKSRLIETQDGVKKNKTRELFRGVDHVGPN